ncbi:zinc finger protein 778 [Trichonephila clavipes]|nr:zinc finger protein 778 [Trichonephila clavipes]
MHLLFLSGEKPHECEICKKSFTAGSDLSKHLRIHTKEKRYISQLFNSAFGTSSGLKKHSRSHSGKKPHECVNFARRPSPPFFGNLLQHLRIHTKKPYCEICRKAFSFSNNLKKRL